jgi:hypothetical protein
VHPLGAALVAGGAAAKLASSAVVNDDGHTWLEITRGLDVLSAGFLVLVAWPVLVRGGDAASRRLAAVAAVSVVVADGIGAIPALTSDQTVSFVVGLAGRAAVLTGLAVAAARRDDAAPVAPEPSPTPAIVPWWAVAALVAAGAALIAVNWPRSGDPYLWHNSDRGWYVYRSWHDAAFVGSVVALLAALGARLARPLAGVVAGVGVFLLTKSAQVLGGGIAYDQRTRWICTALLAAGLVVLVWYALRPRPAAEGWLHPVGPALVLAGAIMILASDRAGRSRLVWVATSSCFPRSVQRLREERARAAAVG